MTRVRETTCLLDAEISCVRHPVSIGGLKDLGKRNHDRNVLKC